MLLSLFLVDDEPLNADATGDKFRIFKILCEQKPPNLNHQFAIDNVVSVLQKRDSAGGGAQPITASNSNLTSCLRSISSSTSSISALITKLSLSFASWKIKRLASKNG
jgi:hypothetical protein